MNKHEIYKEKKQACTKAGWEVEKDTVWAYGMSFPLADPYAIHLKAYRIHESHETRLQAMVAAFHCLWPQHKPTYNYWMERAFREHCDHETDMFSMAGGGGTGKTFVASYIAVLFWLALPNQRAVIVTSTTVESLKARIYGYVLRALKEMVIPFPVRIRNSPPPSINPIQPDFIHGIFGIAANLGDEETTIKNIIGRHPNDSLLIVLDEATDMPMGLLSALPNLRKGLRGRFQAIAIGNSNEVGDLHGAISTPHTGWENIDPYKDFRWKTTQPGGYCLYFNPYDSPAIHEPDLKRKKFLSEILPTEEKIKYAKETEGEDSIGFWRFTMGFWKFRNLNLSIVTEEFLKDYDPTISAEFSGHYPLTIVAGLDPAFSVGGDKCILRLAVLGQHINGSIVLDYRKEHFVFVLQIRANTGKSAEVQIAEQAIAILKQYAVPLNTLCVDASGAGRGLADIIQLMSGTGQTPTKVFSTNISLTHKSEWKKRNSPFEYVITSGHELWFKGREFISHRQIFGLDALAYKQLHTRWIVKKGDKQILEPKSEYKQRMSRISPLLGRSPDEADSAMLALQSAIIHHGFNTGQTRPIKQHESEFHRQFELAKQTYTQHVKKQTSTHFPFSLKATYKKGIESILTKRIF